VLNKNLKKPDQNLVSQSNKLVEASYKMSITAKRVMLLFLGQVHPGQQDISGKVRITASEYSSKSGVDLSQSYKDIQEGCLELMNTVITTKNSVEKTTEKCVVIDWMKYHDNEGWLEATFTRWVSPYIQSLRQSGYTKIKINEALRFKRFYSIRLFELLMQWQDTGSRFITLVDIRNIFQIGKSKYPLFSALKKWVLDPSVKEINEKSSWVVEYTAVKTGKKVTSLSFVFYEKKQNSQNSIHDRCPLTIDMLN